MNINIDTLEELSSCPGPTMTKLTVIKIPNSGPSSSSIRVVLRPTTRIALFTLLLTVLITTSANASNSPALSLDSTLPVHKLRSAYELIQSKSWRLIEQQYASASAGRLTDTVKAKIVKELFAYHHQYVSEKLAEYERENKDHLRTVFPDFNHFYEWNYVQGHINATNSLFDVFREYLKSTVEGAGTDLNGLGAKDFAETVLFDKKWPIEKSFNDIHHIMVGQGLYYKMALVWMINKDSEHKEDPSQFTF